MTERMVLAGLGIDRITEEQVIAHVLGELRTGKGGWIATPNIDICRATWRTPEFRSLVSDASLVVPDGMPLVWAADLRGSPFEERVAGSSLIFTLSEAAAAESRSIYLLGGDPGVPQRAGEQLCRLYPGLTVVGAQDPPLGFDETPSGIGMVRDRVIAARPDIVYVGLGFPKQERLIAVLAPELPSSWFLACGAAIAFAAGTVPRAPMWMQRSGLEWLFRLANEPRRLSKRYLVDDLPFAVALLGSCVLQRIRRAPRASSSSAS